MEILLNALEVAEARVSDVETSLVRAQNTISEQCAGIDKIATANHALAAEAKKTEAENARLTAERDWLAMYAVRDVLLPYQPGLLQSAEKVKEAARRAVAAGDGEQRPLSIKSQK